MKSIRYYLFRLIHPFSYYIPLEVRSCKVDKKLEFIYVDYFNLDRIKVVPHCLYKEQSQFFEKKIHCLEKLLKIETEESKIKFILEELVKAKKELRKAQTLDIEVI